MANAAGEYAKALSSSLEGNQKKTAVLAWLHEFSKAFSENKDFVDQVKSKAISDAESKKVFSELAEQSPEKEILKNFFYLLVDKGRVPLVGEIVKSFQEIVDEESGILRGLIKSALPVSPEKRANLEERFSKKLNKKVLLSYEKDPSVMAGIRVHVGAYTFDDTVERHIKNIKENLNRSWN